MPCVLFLPRIDVSLSDGDIADSFEACCPTEVSNCYYYDGVVDGDHDDCHFNVKVTLRSVCVLILMYSSFHNNSQWVLAYNARDQIRI